MTQAAQCRAHSAVDMTEKTVRATLPQFGRVALSWCFFGIPYGIRTRAATLRGWSPGPLDERDLLRTTTISPLHSVSLDLKGQAKRWGEGNRTPNNRTRNCRVANYTTPQGDDPPSVFHSPEDADGSISAVDSTDHRRYRRPPSDTAQSVSSLSRPKPNSRPIATPPASQI